MVSLSKAEGLELNDLSVPFQLKPFYDFKGEAQRGGGEAQDNHLFCESANGALSPALSGGCCLSSIGKVWIIHPYRKSE